MAKDDLFKEEDGMTRMTFGEHLEDLRRRLFLALIGFVPAVLLGLAIGRPLMLLMAAPVEKELLEFDLDKKKEFAGRYRDLVTRVATKKAQGQSLGSDDVIEQEELHVWMSRQTLRDALGKAFPEFSIRNAPESDGNGDATTANPSDDDALVGPVVMHVDHAAMVLASWSSLSRRLGLVSLSVQESFMAWMKVSLLAGLVISSPWIIFQLWAFVAEGLYRHERRVVYRAMPASIGLFLVGVIFCFWIVLPVVIRFFFGFNKWFGFEPNIRITEWLGFATLLPVVFGACFELPLVMLVLERVGIFTFDVYVSRWRHAILIIAITAMIITPTTDPGSMMLLMGPLTGLYFLGIGLVYLRLAGAGKVPPLSGMAKLRIVAWTVAGVYACGIGVLFALPKAWLPDEWLDSVWRPTTLPVSFLVKTITLADTWWLWGVTLANAYLIALAILRAGEMILRIGRPKPDEKK